MSQQSEPTGAEPTFRARRIAFGFFAQGTVAIGVIAVGGVSIGVVALGGVAIGVVALGGIAVGVLALGGVALGGHALGGVTLGLLSARGGLNLLGAAVLLMPLASVIGSRWVRRSFSPHAGRPEHDNRSEASRVADR